MDGGSGRKEGSDARRERLLWGLLLAGGAAHAAGDLRLPGVSADLHLALTLSACA